LNVVDLQSVSIGSHQPPQADLDRIRTTICNAAVAATILTEIDYSTARAGWQ
jgi:hypothetical protein